MMAVLEVSGGALSMARFSIAGSSKRFCFYSPCTINSSELKSAIDAARAATVVSNVYCEQYIRSCQSNGPKQGFKI
jgi:hypothetical protein